jgi:hypothetical protein
MRLSAGGRWIRTIGSWRKGAGLGGEGDLRVIQTVASHKKLLLLPGTEGSNPSPSSGESANLRSRFRDDAVRATASRFAGVKRPIEVVVLNCCVTYRPEHSEHHLTRSGFRTRRWRRFTRSSAETWRTFVPGSKFTTAIGRLD